MDRKQHLWVLPRDRQQSVIITRRAGETYAFAPVGADPARLAEITAPMYTERELLYLMDAHETSRGADWNTVLGTGRYCPCVVPERLRHPEWDYTCSVHASATA